MKNLLFLSFLVFPISFQGQPLTPLAEFSSIDKKIAMSIHDSYGASVQVHLAGKLLLEKNYGYSDEDKQYPVQTETLFNIASISKTITAIGIFQLVQNHKINLDDNLPRYFKNVPKDKKGILIRHLLTHTSGMEQSYVSDGIVDRGKALSRMFKLKVKAKPGEKWAYSNANYQLLAAIIEIASQQTYEEYIRSMIFEPADMTQSYFWEEIDERENQTVAQVNIKLTEEIRRRNWGYIGSNGIYSTTSDLSKLHKAFQDHTLLSPENSSLMLTPSINIRKDLEMAYGWFIATSETGEQEIWTRGSESWGHNAVIRYFPASQLMITVCTNSGEEISGNRAISDLILGEIQK